MFSLEHWLTQATSSLGQLKKHSTKLISQRSVQARFKSGTLNSISSQEIFNQRQNLPCIMGNSAWPMLRGEKKYENLQTLGEWIEVIRLARDQAQ